MRDSSSRTYPVPVKRSLRQLGRDTRDARRRRRIPAAILAERAGIGRMTLFRIEQGDPSVSLGAYACVWFSLGLIERLAGVADPAFDRTGREIEEEHLPQRIRLPRARSGAGKQAKS